MSKQVAQAFEKALWGNINKCVETGQESVLVLDAGNRVVEIRVSEAGQAGKEILEEVARKVKDATMMRDS